MHLSPMDRVHEPHDLTPAKVANANNELCALHLLSKIELFYIIEFVWPMHSERERESPGNGSQHSHSGHRPAEVDMQVAATLCAHPVAEDQRLCKIEKRVESCVRVPARQTQGGIQAASEHARPAQQGLRRDPHCLPRS